MSFTLKLNVNFRELKKEGHFHHKKFSYESSSYFCLPPEGQEVLNLGVLLVLALVLGIISFLLLFEKT